MRQRHLVLSLLRSRIIPWIKTAGYPRLVVARSRMKQGEMPFGATLSTRPLAGKRAIVRNRRNHANLRTFTANWPDDNQQEMALPKIACVVEGAADYLLGNYCVHAEEGTFIFIPPHMPHHRSGPFLDAKNQSGGACTMLFAYSYNHGVFLWFSRSRGHSHVNDRGNRYLIFSAAAVQILNLFKEETFSPNNDSQSLYRDLLSAFYTLLAREIEAGRYTVPSLNEHEETILSASKNFPNRVVEYIQANLGKHLKVKDAAGQFYMSESHFSRTLRHEAGVSFVELLTRCRIERAQELLRETDWTVHAISGFVGYESSTYFHNLFQQYAGCSPLEYRFQSRSVK